MALDFHSENFKSKDSPAKVGYKHKIADLCVIDQEKWWKIT